MRAVGEVLCRHSPAAAALDPAVPATEAECVAAALRVGLFTAFCSSPATAGGWFQPCSSHCSVPPAQQGRKVFASEQESQTAPTDKPGQKEATQTGLLGKANTCWDTGMEV